MPQNIALPAHRNVTIPWVPILYGTIFLAAIGVLFLTISDRLAEQDEVMTLTISDETGAPVEGALVTYGEELYRSSEDGKVHLEVLDSAEVLLVESAGFKTVAAEFDSSYSRSQSLQLQSVFDTQNAATGGAASGPANDNSGQLALAAAQMDAATPPAEINSVSATPDSGTPVANAGEVAGTVQNVDGEPVVEGWVTDGSAFAFTDADGNFVFDDGEVEPGAQLTVFGAGYHDAVVDAPADGTPLEVTLEHQQIKGIYFNPNLSYNQEDIDRFIQIANTTEVNAIVIDIKEEIVFYDTQVPLFNDAGVVNPIVDLPGLLQQFKDNGIYTIARLVVFKDSLVAEEFPELAVIDNQTGGLWRDMNGVAWVNPMLHDLWEANINLAVEAANHGFDEIQYDYIRFPTDGDLSRVSYGLENTQENREASIEKFLQRSYERLIPLGVKQSADVFGYTVVVEDDLGIGQNLSQLASHLDYLSPMIYPSHWPEGSLALDGHPNDYPYETIEISMSLAINQIDGQRLKLRPWLQDFNMPNMRQYGDAEVRAQIDAVEDLGLSGWLIWDPNNWYHDGAFAPETAPVSAPSTPAVSTPAASSSAATGRARRR